MNVGMGEGNIKEAYSLGSSFLSKCLICALVFWGCHNKLPQNGWLETTEMCSLAVSEVQSLK